MTVSMILAAALAFQGAAQQFDLICTATMRSSSSNIPGESSKETVNRARVDLSRNIWCWETCTEINTFTEVSPSELVMGRSDDEKGETDIVVDRINGKFKSHFLLHMDGFDISIRSDGRCARAPYTAIPQAAF